MASPPPMRSDDELGGRGVPIQDVEPRSEILLPSRPTQDGAVVVSFTDYRAWCGICMWQGVPTHRRKYANADMREHNKEFHA